MANDLNNLNAQREKIILMTDLCWKLLKKILFQALTARKNIIKMMISLQF